MISFDIVQLTRKNARAFLPLLTETSRRSPLMGGELAFGCVTGDLACGAISARPAGELGYEITSLFIAPEYRHNGGAGAMLRQLENVVGYSQYPALSASYVCKEEDAALLDGFFSTHGFSMPKLTDALISIPLKQFCNTLDAKLPESHRELLPGICRLRDLSPQAKRDLRARKGVELPEELLPGLIPENALPELSMAWRDRSDIVRAFILVRRVGDIVNLRSIYLQDMKYAPALAALLHLLSDRIPQHCPNCTHLTCTGAEQMRRLFANTDYAECALHTTYKVLSPAEYRHLPQEGSLVLSRLSQIAAVLQARDDEICRLGVASDNTPELIRPIMLSGCSQATRISCIAVDPGSYTEFLVCAVTFFETACPLKEAPEALADRFNAMELGGCFACPDGTDRMLLRGVLPTGEMPSSKALMEFFTIYDAGILQLDDMLKGGAHDTKTI